MSLRRVLSGSSVLPAMERARNRIQVGRMLEIAGVCGGLWASAAAVTPVTTAFFLGLLGTHLTVSEKLRKFLFFGISARNVVAVDLVLETEDKIDLEISTDAGKRRISLVLESELPENSERVLFREMLELGALKFPTAAGEGAEEGERVLERLRKEDFAIVSEESEISLPDGGRNFRLTDITRERVKTMQLRMPPWMKNKKISGEELIEKHANQQVFLGALTFGMATVLSIRANTKEDVQQGGGGGAGGRGEKKQEQFS